LSQLVILIPVLKRPHRVRPVLDSIAENTPGRLRVLFIPDPDDEPEITALTKASAEFIEIRGNYGKKINAGVRHTTEPLLFFGADDLEFHPGWLEAAKAQLTEGIGVVATNDLCNPRVMRGELATHPLVTREYCKLGKIDDPDFVLHEQYQHEYVDREFSETAQHRGAFAYAAGSIVEHLHPMVGKAPTDELYDRLWDRMYQGRRVYNRRMHKWGMDRKKNEERNRGDKRWMSRS
jgi:glycosyltransferase involved in cell wall biosynthesis